MSLFTAERNTTSRSTVPRLIAAALNVIACRLMTTALRRRLAEQQSFDADVFVEVGPMFSVASAAYLKTSAFRGVTFARRGIPTDGNGNRAAVLEINRQCLVVE